MRLIVISHPQDLGSEQGLIARLFDAGMKYFHLRKPDYSVEDYKRYIESVPVKYHKNIIIHKYIDLYSEYNLKGVHFSSDNKNRINEFGDSRIQKSISCHSFEEILNLAGFSYAFLSPVYDSITKEGYNSRFRAKDIKDFFHNNVLTTKVIALGGISLENIDNAMSLGFDGAAVMGALWNNIMNKDKDSTVNYFIELKRKCRQFVRTY